jgi:NAD(P)-dependent dehydrogenase (short-subunit alcohol dehydrogenase family)
MTEAPPIPGLWRSNWHTREYASMQSPPGWVTVESYYGAIPGFDLENAREVAKNKIPAGFYGVPLDIAKLAVFLCSDDSRYIVGQTIIVDGGTTALMSLLSDFRLESAARFARGRVPAER